MIDRFRLPRLIDAFQDILMLVVPKLDQFVYKVRLRFDGHFLRPRHVCSNYFLFLFHL